MEPGTSGSFESVVLPHLDAAYGFARALLRDGPAAEDAVQDAVLRALTHFDGFRGEASAARGWLLTIVRHSCYSWHRGNRDARVVPLEMSEPVARETPETELLRQTQGERIAGALEGLPPEYREVILLREISGLSYKEISEVVAVPVGTVMSRLSRARARLQRALRGEVEP